MKHGPAIFAISLVSVSLLLLGSACGGSEEENPFGLESELVATIGLTDALAFAPDGRLFWADHWGGDVRVITADGELLEDPVIHFDVVSGHERGLTGLALDPNFESNHYVYALLTEPVDLDQPTGRAVVVRFTEANNRGTDRKVVVADLPETDPERPGFKITGSIHFGPDGFLYASLGDYDLAKTIGPGGEPFAQDLSTPIGKMLRVNKEDGSAPSDNPFFDQPGADPRIFAYGFSRAFDFAFHPSSGQIYGTDNTASCEELNLIKSGGNFGWPEVGEFPFSDCTAGEQIKAIHFFSLEGMEPGDFLSIVSIGGMEFISGDKYPLLEDGLLVCEGETGLMRLLVLGGPDSDAVVSDDVVVDDCGRDIAISPDGLIYYSNETEIRRLVPVSTE